MAFTEDDLTKLDRAIAVGRGVKTISFADQTTSFRSVSEMKELRSLMAREINAARTHRLAIVSKGT